MPSDEADPFPAQVQRNRSTRFIVIFAIASNFVKPEGNSPRIQGAPCRLNDMPGFTHRLSDGPPCAASLRWWLSRWPRAHPRRMPWWDESPAPRSARVSWTWSMQRAPMPGNAATPVTPRPRHSSESNSLERRGGRSCAQHGPEEILRSSGSGWQSAERPRDSRWLQPRLTGENIALGPESAEEVVAGWLASPGHCANIMDDRFQHIGVGLSVGRRSRQDLLGAELRRAALTARSPARLPYNVSHGNFR